MKILVLGADSSVGSRVFRLGLDSLSPDILGTTRRANAADDLIFLDLLDDSTWSTALDLDPDIVLAFFAVSNLVECEENPIAREINVTQVVKLMDRFGRAGSRVIFISTNSVFGGERDHCNETDSVTPGLEYSRQKVEAENSLLGNAQEHNYSERVCIVRITRVLTEETAPFPSWAEELKNGGTVEAFSDFIFAPISYHFAAKSIFRIALSSESGVFHLSGEQDISYFDFASRINEVSGGKGSVVPTTSVEKGVKILFLPTYSALGMGRTKELLGIVPQTDASVIEDLIGMWSPAGSCAEHA